MSSIFKDLSTFDRPASDDFLVDEKFRLDAEFGEWRKVKYEDIEEAIDGIKIYCLFDPLQSQGFRGILVYDSVFRAFCGKIPLNLPGKMTNVFSLSLKHSSPTGGPSMVVVSKEEVERQFRIYIHRIDFSPDGLSIDNIQNLTPDESTFEGHHMVMMNAERLEMLIASGPGLSVTSIRIGDTPHPVSRIKVSGSDLHQYGYSFWINQYIVFLATTSDGHLDPTRVHLLNLNNPQSIVSQDITADLNHGIPYPRKRSGLETSTSGILMVSGEVNYGNEMSMITDTWMIDMYFGMPRWVKLPYTLPYTFLEPNLKTSLSGYSFIWGNNAPMIGNHEYQENFRVVRIRVPHLSGIQGGQQAGQNIYYNCIPNLDQNGFISPEGYNNPNIVNSRYTGPFPYHEF